MGGGGRQDRDVRPERGCEAAAGSRRQTREGVDDGRRRESDTATLRNQDGFLLCVNRFNLCLGSHVCKKKSFA